jgi:hypothetical protein
MELSDPELPARHGTQGTRSLLPRGRSPGRSAGRRRPLFTPQAIARHDELPNRIAPQLQPPVSGKLFTFGKTTLPWSPVISG